MKRHKQAEAFISEEGDRWFERNWATGMPSTPVHAIPIDMIAQIVVDGRRLLEIGCSNGRNLATLSTRHGIDAYGIDPSAQAIAACRKNFPSLNLTTGTADQLPYPPEHFDVVWFGFCLYLIDRPLLMASLAEADRVLRDGGFLVITDFDPPSARMRPYKHREGLFSYKMDYSALFLANPAYSLIEKKSYSHTSTAFDPDPDERVATSILQKSTLTAYPID